MADYIVQTGMPQSGRITMGGTDTLTVQSTGVLSVSANNQSVRFTSATTNGIINNEGTIENTAAGGRAIRIETNAGDSFTGEFTNFSTGIIQSDDDAIQFQSPITSGTIVLGNQGLISSAVGQAVDFSSVDGADITITNSGTIQSGTNDAIRTGANATVTNAAGGIIDGGNVAGFTPSADGVDFRAFGGTLNNYGDISADRHAVNAGDDGVTGFITVTNYGTGTITGRNGSGVGSDGSGEVINYGRITGSFSNDIASDEHGPAGEVPDGIPDGDGDGIDFDFDATITNYGIIEGKGAGGHGSDGFANTSEGIAIGGGSITNYAGAQITGLGLGILVDDSSRGNAPFLTTITNNGTIEGATLEAIKLVSDHNDTIFNNGTITGGNGTAILFGSGDNSLTLGSNSAITGLTDGGLGTNWLIYDNWTTGVTVSLGKGSATGTGKVANFQNVTGSDGDDRLLGDAAANVLSGGDGNDRINGGIGDTLNGGDGNDTITIDGAAVIDGGAGTDTLIVVGDTTFAAGSISGIERIVVGDGATADFSLLDDGLTIASRSVIGGTATIIGTAGDDRISARGDDYLVGGAGDDTLIGGAGADLFAFTEAGFGRDTVARFADGIDRIEISTALAIDFASLNIIDQGSRSVVDFGNGDLIILRGIDAANLSAADFLFVA